jgi:orotate phosphoribosyltransferase
MAYPPDATVGLLTSLIDARHGRSVADALVASGAFTIDMRMPRDRWFRWKSGILAPCGCNCRRLNTVPAFRRVVDDALADATRSSFADADYIVAVAMAGIPWAKTLAERLDLPLAYVRAEARAVGGPLVECAPGRGARAVIVEDVVASGGSTARAIQALLAETELGIAGVQSIANWNFPEMRAALAPWTVRAITSYPQVLASAHEAGLVSAPDVGQLLRFYADPRRHSWQVTDGPSGQALCRALARNATPVSNSDSRPSIRHRMRVIHDSNPYPGHLEQHVFQQLLPRSDGATCVSA